MVRPEDRTIDADVSLELKLKDHEDGNEVILLIPRKAGYSPVKIALTQLTAAELSAIRQTFELAFELARPVVEHRDKVAHDAFLAGDDSYTRSYRAPAEFVVRKGPVGADCESILHRLVDAFAGDWDGVNTIRSVAGGGYELAHREPQEAGSEYDEPQADQP